MIAFTNMITLTHPVIASQSLNIEQAEQLILSQDPELAAQQKTLQIQNIATEKHLWSLSPSLTASAGYSRQDETTTDTKTLTLSQSLPLPTRWLSEKRRLDGVN